MKKTADFSSAIWRKGNGSGDGNCVEVATADGMIGVRDSKDPSGPVLVFTPTEWRVFADAIKADEFE